MNYHAPKNTFKFMRVCTSRVSKQMWRNMFPRQNSQNLHDNQGQFFRPLCFFMFVLLMHCRNEHPAQKTRPNSRAFTLPVSAKKFGEKCSRDKMLKMYTTARDNVFGHCVSFICLVPMHCQNEHRTQENPCKLMRVCTSRASKKMWRNIFPTHNSQNVHDNQG